MLVGSLACHTYLRVLEQQQKSPPIGDTDVVYCHWGPAHAQVLEVGLKDTVERDDICYVKESGHTSWVASCMNKRDVSIVLRFNNSCCTTASKEDRVGGANVALLPRQ